MYFHSCCCQVALPLQVLPSPLSSLYTKYADDWTLNQASIVCIPDEVTINSLSEHFISTIELLLNFITNNTIIWTNICWQTSNCYKISGKYWSNCQLRDFAVIRKLIYFILLLYTYRIWNFLILCRPKCGRCWKVYCSEKFATDWGAVEKGNKSHSLYFSIYCY